MGPSLVSDMSNLRCAPHNRLEARCIVAVWPKEAAEIIRSLGECVRRTQVALDQ